MKMTEIKLYKSPRKAIKIFALTFPFVVTGVWMITREGGDSVSRIIGWISCLFFGLGIPVGLFQLLDRRPQIIINEIGIWDRTMNQDIVINWEVIQEAYLIDISGQSFISIVVDESFEQKIKQYKWATLLSKQVGAQKINLHLEQINIDRIRLTEFINAMTNADTSQKKTLIKTLPNIKQAFQQPAKAQG